MIAWLNVVVFVVSALVCTCFYAKSGGPAALERKIGPSAYEKCQRYRVISGIFMLVNFANYVLYFFYPLPISLPRTFPCPGRFRSSSPS